MASCLMRGHTAVEALGWTARRVGVVYPWEILRADYKVAQPNSRMKRDGRFLVPHLELEGEM